VYFTAQATHLEHLTRKFEGAVDEAMALSQSARHGHMAAALAKRFPVPEMMQQYADAWAQVSGWAVCLPLQHCCAQLLSCCNFFTRHATQQLPS